MDTPAGNSVSQFLLHTCDTHTSAQVGNDGNELGERGGSKG